MNRGELWWASLPDPAGSSPGYRRPVLIVQSDVFTASAIQTILVLAITSNLRLANAPGNVFMSRQQSGLNRDSIINVSQILTIDKTMLTDFINSLPARKMQQVEAGMRLVLSL
jgi:mRNA interferase MazF